MSPANEEVILVFIARLTNPPCPVEMTQNSYIQRAHLLQIHWILLTFFHLCLNINTWKYTKQGLNKLEELDHGCYCAPSISLNGIQGNYQSLSFPSSETNQTGSIIATKSKRKKIKKKKEKVSNKAAVQVCCSNRTMGHTALQKISSDSTRTWTSLNVQRAEWAQLNPWMRQRANDYFLTFPTLAGEAEKDSRLLGGLACRRAEVHFQLGWVPLCLNV